MTVCVAAICQLNEKRQPQYIPMIVGTSDRMLSAGDVQYEPQQTKTWGLTKKFGVMIAGDAAVHSRIILDVIREFKDRDDATVLDVAEAYGAQMSEYRKRECERLFLNPLGLSYNDFIARQNDLAPQTVDQISGRLQRYRLQAEAVIFGVDSEGPHLYVIDDPGTVSSRDLVGFAAIGIGASHASSELMSARYSREWGFARAVFEVFKAKKRAEVAPGVGQDTDMVYADLTQYWLLTPEYDDKKMLEQLLATYKHEREAIGRATGLAEQEVVKYVQGLIEAAQTAAQAEAQSQAQPVTARNQP